MFENAHLDYPLIAEIEAFVDAATAAKFLCVKRRRVLQMARSKEIPAHPIGRGRRKQWRFRLSELAQAIRQRVPELAKNANRSYGRK